MARVQRLCSCGRVVVGACESCQSIDQASVDDSRGTSQYDSRWSRLSKRKRRANPLCERCESKDYITLATEVHHIQKIRDAPHLKYDWENLMSVCSRCHAILDKSKGNGK